MGLTVIKPVVTAVTWINVQIQMERALLDVTLVFKESCATQVCYDFKYCQGGLIVVKLTTLSALTLKYDVFDHMVCYS